MKAIRLDKFLADMGQGTRSEIKNWIRKGLVTVDGEVVKRPETKVDPDIQQVELRKVRICYQQFEYYLFHKPAGCVSATEDNLHKTVLDYLEEDHRKDLFPVGRLDLDTEGLLLITNDGALAHDLLSPRKHVDKTYYAKIDQTVTEEDVRRFAEGLDIGEKELTLPAQLEIIREREVLVTVCEGKFHQIKRMFEAIGKEVVYLKRVRMGSLVLEDSLEKGSYRRLTEDEIRQLRGESC